MDTTLPSLEDLGLGILRGKPSGVISHAKGGYSGIGELHATANPFKNETTISFDMDESAYIWFQVFDQLGLVRQGDMRGTVYSPGHHSFTIDGSHLATGTFYARIATPTGDVRTIKLTHE